MYGEDYGAWDTPDLTPFSSWHLVQGRLVDRAVLVHFRKPDAWLWIIRGKRLGYRTVYTEDVVPVDHTQLYYEGLARAMPALDAVTAVSGASAASIRPYCMPDSRIHIIANMVYGPADSELEAKRQDTAFTVGCIARLVPQKDINTLLLAARAAVEQNPCLQFLIYGDGPQLGELEGRAESLGLGQNVIFAGAFARVQLAEVMAAVDLVVLSSIYEGFGVVLVEGMAYGKPAVATAVGGVPEVVVDGVSGLLVPPRSPQRMADAILELASDSELYRRMAAAARERYLRCYTPDIIVPQYLAVYERIVPGAQEDHDSSQ